MTSTYAVQVECASGGEDNEAYDAALAALDEKVVDAVIRDDGTAVFWLEWAPQAEAGDDGAKTWMAAKDSLDHIKSTFAGFGVPVVELRVGEHEYERKRRTTKVDA